MRLTGNIVSHKGSARAIETETRDSKLVNTVFRYLIPAQISQKCGETWRLGQSILGMQIRNRIKRREEEIAACAMEEILGVIYIV